MKKFVFISLVLWLGFCLFGCGKKQASLEDSQEAVSMEALTTATGNIPAAESVVSAPVALVSDLAPLPPVGHFKPTAQEIQTALKNAGFYTGPVDGKIGPKSKRAIEEFQKTNNLKVDGKVGPKTWAALSKYLNPQSPSTTPKKR